MSRSLLSIRQACECAAVSRRTIYNWLESGKLEYLRTAGGSIRIYADTLMIGPTEQIETERSTRALANYNRRKPRSA